MLAARETAGHSAVGVEIVLRDGSTVHVRPLRAGDRDALARFFASLSDRSRRLRFFSGAANVDEASRFAVDSALEQGYGLVATRGDGRVVAHAMYGRNDAEHAEVALRGRRRAPGERDRHDASRPPGGAGRRSRDPGVLAPRSSPRTTRWSTSSAKAASPIETRSLPGVIEVTVPDGALGRCTKAVRGSRADGRGRVPCGRSSSPPSVAVVGASRNPGTVGQRDAAEPRAGRLRGTGLRGQPVRRGDRRASRVPLRRRHTGSGGAGASSRRRRRRWSASRATAPPRACGRSSCCRPASPRRVRRGRRASTSCSRSAGLPGCGSSARTASAS